MDDAIRAILGTDRVWSAYALADLSPPWREYAEWSLGDESLVLVYRGLTPPVLFGIGEPDELRYLFQQLSSGSYWYTLRPNDFELVRDRLESFSRTRMWRMRLKDDTRIQKPEGVTKLHQADQARIERLYGAHPDRPDAYQPDQVEYGAYFGVFERGNLVSVAGTHVLNRELGIAAVGNVFTAPQHRRRGFGRAVSAGVVAHLVELGIKTIVLNVEMANSLATEMYRKLGFTPYCGFYEGTAELI